MWRQGDVLIQKVDRLPDNTERMPRPILAVGASTGKSHKVRDRKTAAVYRRDWWVSQDLYLDVTEEQTEIVHPEHHTITLPRGVYRVWRQRELHGRVINTVFD